MNSISKSAHKHDAFSQRDTWLMETQRLKLRCFNLDDAKILYELNADPSVLRFTGDPPFQSFSHAAEFIKSYHHYRDHGYGRWMVVRKEDDVVLGWCGLKNAPDIEEIDLGFRFFRKFWNQGYATEAAKACLEYGSEKLGLKDIVGRSAKDNPASIRVLEKLGMTYAEDFTWERQEWAVYK